MIQRTCLFGLCFLILLAAVPANKLRAGQRSRSLIVRSIDEGKVVMLRGNTRQEANAANDRGRVDDEFPLEHMWLLLRRPPEQEHALDQFIEQLQNPKSPNYHKWLTAAEFGQRYGVAEGDILTITGWLQSHHFEVNQVYPNRMLIDFSGTAGQVHMAFHTEIHHLVVNGVKHFANVSEPMIPAALAPAVVGVVSLNDFRPHPMNHPRSQFSVGGGSPYLMVPADLATIYDLNPLFNAGYSGQGQTIVVVEDSNVYSTVDWGSFRTALGLSGYTSGSFTQIHPPISGTNDCTDPGVLAAVEFEAILDAEWASAAAPKGISCLFIRWGN